jgi:hypothetical protein
MVSRASICSEIRMMPISAAMADPARATTMMAVRHRPHLPDQGQGHGIEPRDPVGAVTSPVT